MKVTHPGKSEPIRVACKECIYGHRAPSCTHINKVLVEVRPPGRPRVHCVHGRVHEGKDRCRECFPAIAYIVPGHRDRLGECSCHTNVEEPIRDAKLAPKEVAEAHEDEREQAKEMRKLRQSKGSLPQDFHRQPWNSGPVPVLPAPILPAPAFPTPMLPAPTFPAPMLPAPTFPAPVLPAPTYPAPALPTPMLPAPIGIKRPHSHGGIGLSDHQNGSSGCSHNPKSCCQSASGSSTSGLPPRKRPKVRLLSYPKEVELKAGSPQPLDRCKCKSGACTCPGCRDHPMNDATKGIVRSTWDAWVQEVRGQRSQSQLQTSQHANPPQYVGPPRPQTVPTVGFSSTPAPGQLLSSGAPSRNAEGTHTQMPEAQAFGFEQFQGHGRPTSQVQQSERDAEVLNHRLALSNAMSAAPLQRHQGPASLGDPYQPDAPSLLNAPGMAGQADLEVQHPRPQPKVSLLTQQLQQIQIPEASPTSPNMPSASSGGSWTPGNFGMMSPAELSGFGFDFESFESYFEPLAIFNDCTNRNCQCGAGCMCEGCCIHIGHFEGQQYGELTIEEAEDLEDMAVNPNGAGNRNPIAGWENAYLPQPDYNFFPQSAATEGGPVSQYSVFREGHDRFPPSDGRSSLPFHAGMSQQFQGPGDASLQNTYPTASAYSGASSATLPQGAYEHYIHHDPRQGHIATEPHEQNQLPEMLGSMAMAMPSAAQQMHEGRMPWGYHASTSPAFASQIPTSAQSEPQGDPTLVHETNRQNSPPTQQPHPRPVFGERFNNEKS